jgi:hypothetical protein
MKWIKMTERKPPKGKEVCFWNTPQGAFYSGEYREYDSGAKMVHVGFGNYRRLSDFNYWAEIMFVLGLQIKGCQRRK